ncbi:hypothetical protein KYN89_09545 [Alteriqipengyuania sp. NZ-12B]|uniref:Uncharacterized protein n=1 Tax=Alteriqipengyuania abyssalis TaxID=2860200 RepID=A0ABS7PDZ3_9SPHN|nr:hypothetical protein [Alteriqipengyuania abyssalis]MBY8337294.1 hypothetical protein [Alteriqipengyuania abyssalis]
MQNNEGQGFMASLFERAAWEWQAAREEQSVEGGEATDPAHDPCNHLHINGAIMLAGLERAGEPGSADQSRP